MWGGEWRQSIVSTIANKLLWPIVNTKTNLAIYNTSRTKNMYYIRELLRIIYQFMMMWR